MLWLTLGHNGAGREAGLPVGYILCGPFKCQPLMHARVKQQVAVGSEAASTLAVFTVLHHSTALGLFTSREQKRMTRLPKCNPPPGVLCMCTSPECTQRTFRPLRGVFQRIFNRLAGGACMAQSTTDAPFDAQTDSHGDPLHPRDRTCRSTQRTDHFTARRISTSAAKGCFWTYLRHVLCLLCCGQTPVYEGHALGPLGIVPHMPPIRYDIAQEGNIFDPS